MTLDITAAQLLEQMAAKRDYHDELGVRHVQQAERLTRAIEALTEYDQNEAPDFQMVAGDAGAFDEPEAWIGAPDPAGNGGGPVSKADIGREREDEPDDSDIGYDEAQAVFGDYPRPPLAPPPDPPEPEPRPPNKAEIGRRREEEILALVADEPGLIQTDLDARLGLGRTGSAAALGRLVRRRKIVRVKVRHENARGRMAWTFALYLAGDEPAASEPASLPAEDEDEKPEPDPRADPSSPERNAGIDRGRPSDAEIDAAYAERGPTPEPGLSEPEALEGLILQRLITQPRTAGDLIDGLHAERIAFDERDIVRLIAKLRDEGHLLLRPDKLLEGRP